jgi:Competence protein CoiA-like family
MSENILLPFGLRSDGLMIHISDAEQGKACDCVCPVCESPLVARKGEKNTHHFAHEIDTNCQYAAETAAHLMAKSILERVGHIFVPDYVLNLSDRVSVGVRYEDVHTDKKIVNEQSIAFDGVRIEQTFQDIVPDLLVNVGGTDLLIEICVTHKVDSKKLKKIRTYSLPTLEINMNDILGLPNTDEFEQALIKQTENKSWLFHPRQVATETEHQYKIDDAKARMKRPKRGFNPHRKFDFTRKQKPRVVPKAEFTYDKAFESRVELEGNIFYKKNGRWPDNNETTQIINRIRFNKRSIYDQQIQSAKDYFYKRNGRWPDTTEYNEIIKSLSKK